MAVIASHHLEYSTRCQASERAEGAREGWVCYTVCGWLPSYVKAYLEHQVELYRGRNLYKAVLVLQKPGPGHGLQGRSRKPDELRSPWVYPWGVVTETKW
jgi:hypothetical protein